MPETEVFAPNSPLEASNEEDAHGTNCAISKLAPRMYPDRYPLWQIIPSAIAGAFSIFLWPFFPSLTKGLLFDVFLSRMRDASFRGPSTSRLPALIQVHRAALSAVSLDDPRRFVISRNFGHDLSFQYNETGDLKDLLESIRALREALSLRHPRHPDCAEPSMMLANNLHLLFVGIKRREVIEEAIQLSRNAIDLLPPSEHDQRHRALRTLSESLRVASTHVILNTFEESVDSAREALDLCPPGHNERDLSLAQLSAALKARYERSQDVHDLDESIMLQRESMTLLTGPRPPRLPIAIYNLALCLLTRYDRTHDIADLEEIRVHADECDTLLKPYERHPAMPLLWWTLAPVYFRDLNAQNYERGFALLEKATKHPFSSSFNRLQAALAWVWYARPLKHPTTGDAYSEALRLVGEHLRVRPSVEWQREFFGQEGIRTLPSAAASYFIEMGDVERAVEILEQGRARTWSMLRGYRPPLDIDRLKTTNPLLADRLSFNLEWLSELSLTRVSEIPHWRQYPTQKPNLTVESPFEYVLSGQLMLTEDLAATLQSIRSIDGFRTFLGNDFSYNHLAQAACEGPVIIVNVDSFRSDAIIVYPNRSSMVVPLAATLQKTVNQISHKLDQVVSTAREERYDSVTSNRRTADITTILCLIWGQICEPVVKELRANGVQEQSRVWWCPTGTLGLLPLHAAGPYKNGKENMSDIFVSSYAPTLSSLISARLIRRNVAERRGHLLAVGQSKALPQVKPEIQRIQHVFSSGIADVLVRDNDEATPGQVLEDMKNNPWVHFACHGSLKPGEPFTSSFKLHNNSDLTLMTIAKAQIPNAELAFLAACHSAAGDARGSVDEILSLAGALQFCGYRSVVGTLWVMNDSDGPELAGSFYERMVKGDLDFRKSAMALHAAVKDMQARKVPTERWCTFIHIGV